MRWLLVLTEDGINPCGSDYAQSTQLTQGAALKRRAEMMLRAYKAHSVYLLTETQFNSPASHRMGPAEYGDYVKEVGRKII